ncbi:MAG TPA: DUF3999 family protein, partial [bacterium]|nr:DUF3999 family protein [bacterium]
QWQTLRDGAYILRFAGDQTVGVSEVRYGRSDFRYLRLTVREVPAGVALDQVTVAERIDEPGDFVLLAHAGPPAVVAAARGRESTAQFDLFGAPHRRVAVAVAGGGDFQREVALLTADRPDGPWRYAGGGVIYRSGARQELTVDYPEQQQRYLQVVIRHYDDAPLPVTAITVLGVPQYLCYRADARRAFLYYGNAAAAAPRYDLAAQWQANHARPAGTAAGVGPEEVNPAWRAPEAPLVETRPWLIYVGLGLGVVLLGLLAVQLLRQEKRSC